MADIHVSQGGIEVVSEIDVENQVSQGGVEVVHSVDVTEVQISQGGVEVTSEQDRTYIRISQGGIEIAYVQGGRVYSFDVSFEAATPSDYVQPSGIAIEDIAAADVVYTSEVAFDEIE